LRVLYILPGVAAAHLRGLLDPDPQLLLRILWRRLEILIRPAVPSTLMPDLSYEEIVAAQR